MRIIETKVYHIGEHPSPSLCFDYIRDNWHDLGSYCLEEMVASLKALASHVGGSLGYCLSIEPDRGEFVTIKDYDKELLAELYKTKDDYPLTGHCYDYDVIEGLYNGDLHQTVIKQLHAEGAYIYSDEGLRETCEANEYEFKETGEAI